MSLKTQLLLFLLLTVHVTSCDNRNIHQVVKEIAEAPVDTAGLTSMTIRTNDFSSVEIDCFADVTFHQQKDLGAPMVRLMARSEVLEHVFTKTADEVLNISTDRRYRMPEKAVIVIDVYAPYVNKFMLNGVKCLRLGNMILNSSVFLELNGVGALMSQSLTAHEVSVRLVGSGSIDLKGVKTGRLAAEIYGSGNIYLQGTCREKIFREKGTGLIIYNP